MGHGPELVRDAKAYYEIEVLALPVRLASMALGPVHARHRSASRNVDRGGVARVTLDVVLNYVFITGRYGMPRLGVVGAAVGDERRRLHRIPHRRKRRGQCAGAHGLPNGADGAALAVAQAVGETRAAIGTAGDERDHGVVHLHDVVDGDLQPGRDDGQQLHDAVHEGQLYAGVRLSGAVTALVGRYIGMGRLDLARKRAHLGFAVATSYMIGCGIVFFAGRHRLIGLFSGDAEVIRIGAILLTVAAIYQLFDAMYIIYIGALRGVGDTTVPAWITASLCWTVVVGGGFLVGHYFHELGPVGPWVMAMGYGLTIGTVLIVRFTRGDWKAIVSAREPEQPGFGATTCEPALSNAAAT
jgi:MATE family multidrug resistance protein